LLLERAPGLAVVVVHSPAFAWNPDGNDLPDILNNVMQNELAIAKQNRQPSAPLLGLGVTATCQSTGLVAVGTHRDNERDSSSERRVSSEVQAKVSKDTQNAADRRFRQTFASFTNIGFEQPYDFDKLGRTYGEQSYIAVVHADGNGMGKRFKALDKRGLTNREYINAYRELSKHIQQAGKAALNSSLAPLITATGNLIEPYERNNFLPFRLLVYGGDDVTFVCDGRLGLLLAARYLEAFEQEMEKRTGDATTACAGVAIVKAHYPFAQAYHLSEALCKNAKRYTTEQSTPHSNISALDWHIASSGVLGSLSEIRDREYSGKNGSLTMRPIRLHESPDEWRTWPGLLKIVAAFHSNPEWAGKRNKIKRLREVLRGGSTETEQFLKLYRLSTHSLPVYPAAPPALQQRGWLDQVCGYFDPIEAMDFFDMRHLEHFYDTILAEHLPAK
jgi:hypothetical protein